MSYRWNYHGQTHRGERKKSRVGATFTVVPGRRRLMTLLGDAAHHRDDRKGRPYADLPLRLQVLRIFCKFILLFFAECVRMQ